MNKQDHVHLLEDYRNDVFKNIKHGRTTFKNASRAAPAGISRRLPYFEGGLMTVFPTTPTVESHFSIEMGECDASKV